MIIDKLENAEKYYSLGNGIKEALEFLQNIRNKNLSDGKHLINGEKLYAIVGRYKTKTKDEGKWEAHKKFIDVQFVASGSEKMGCTNISTLQITEEYNLENDVMFLQGDGNYFNINQGGFTIFFPHDAHMPGLNPGKSENVVKIVVKVSIDY